MKGRPDEQVKAARRAIDHAQREWLDKHLTPEQLNRLVQIDLQWEGPSALVSRPVIGQTLALSPEQRIALKQAVAARDAARTDPRVSREAAEHALGKQSLLLLTPGQRDRWRLMLGEAFVPQLAASRTSQPPAR